MKIKSRQKANQTRVCPYCRSDVNLDHILVACGACYAYHHHDCWYELKQCSVCKSADMLVRDQDQVAVSELMTDGYHEQISKRILDKLDQIDDILYERSGDYKFEALNIAYELQRYINTLEDEEKTKQDDSLELILQIIADLEPDVKSQTTEAADWNFAPLMYFMPSILSMLPALAVVGFLLLQPDFWSNAPKMGHVSNTDGTLLTPTIIFSLLGCTLVLVDKLAAMDLNQGNSHQHNATGKATIQGLLCLYITAAVSLISYLS